MYWFYGDICQFFKTLKLYFNYTNLKNYDEWNLIFNLIFALSKHGTPYSPKKKKHGMPRSCPSFCVTHKKNSVLSKPEKHNNESIKSCVVNAYSLFFLRLFFFFFWFRILLHYQIIYIIKYIAQVIQCKVKQSSNIGSNSKRWRRPWEE